MSHAFIRGLARCLIETMPAKTETAETILATEFREAGERFLYFHFTLGKGEKGVARVASDLGKPVRELGKLLHLHTPELRIGSPTEGQLRHEGDGTPGEFELLSQGLELTVRKLTELAKHTPAFEGSESHRLFDVVTDRLTEGGHRMVVIASQLEEANLILTDPTLDRTYLHRLERRLSREVSALDEFLFDLRDRISIALVDAKFPTGKAEPEKVRLLEELIRV